VLGQVPTPVDVAGVALVVAGVATHREAGAAAPSRRPAGGAYTAEASASAVVASAAGSGGASGSGAG
jgi:hypothetical protein